MTGRLQFLNHTLQGIIGRFEDEFPECALKSKTERTRRDPPTFPYDPTPASTSMTPGDQETEPVEQPIAASNLAVANVDQEADANQSSPRSRPITIANIEDLMGYGAVGEGGLSYPHLNEALEAYQTQSGGPLGRRHSASSLAARAQETEEGRIHKLGQRMRRDVLPPLGTDDHLHKTSSADEPEAPHLAALRKRLEELGGEEIREKLMEKGLDATVRELSEMSEEERSREVGLTKMINTSASPKTNDGVS